MRQGIGKEGDRTEAESISRAQEKKKSNPTQTETPRDTQYTHTRIRRADYPTWRSAGGGGRAHIRTLTTPEHGLVHPLRLCRPPPPPQYAACHSDPPPIPPPPQTAFACVRLYIPKSLLRHFRRLPPSPAVRPPNNTPLKTTFPLFLFSFSRQATGLCLGTYRAA